MNHLFVPHMEILSPAQRRLWSGLRLTSQLGLVLYDGTAIALRVGHRCSIDFDFFTDKPLDKQALRNALPFINGALVLQDQPDTFTVLVTSKNTQSESKALLREKEDVKLSFFGTIDFGRVGEPETTEDGVLQVASLYDLMATKLKVILQRIEAKDYRDIAALINAGCSLAKGLAAACALCGFSFQPSESLKALVYFEGGDLNTFPHKDRDALIRAASAVRELPHVRIASNELSVRDSYNGMGLRR